MHVSTSASLVGCVWLLLPLACPTCTAAELAPTEQGPTEQGPTEQGPTEQGPIEQGPIEQGPTEQGPTEQGPIEQGPIELVRDQWGIPHVFANTDQGAMYGLGYATAEDRAFQMVLSLRIMQGRLAESVGDIPKLRRQESAVDSDRKMRTFGFARAAQEVAQQLDAETRSLLQAYCDGVNAYLQQPAPKLHPLFEKYHIQTAPWTPADCLVSWWHLGQFFATDGTRDLISFRNLTDGNQRSRAQRRMEAIGRQPHSDLIPLPADDSAAVVQRDDVSAAWVRKVDAFAEQHGLHPTAQPAPAGPKFSHAWVVGGKRSSTGSSVLVSDPQTPIRNPSLFYEFHVRGHSFNARGIGVPGSPAILIGFTDQVAWGLTALGADQADLFRLKTDTEHPNQYFFDGQWREMTIRQEQIAVRNGQPVELVVRETHFGPVATNFCFARPGDGEVALKRIPVCETDRETIQGVLAMMRAKDAQEFSQALPRWRFPSANIVYGDRHGKIGYAVLGAIPLRSASALQDGRAAHDGSAAKFDWQGYIPHPLLPQLIQPDRGYLFSANHRPISSFYNLPLGVMTGAGGDTVRSWRLRELLAAQESYQPEDVLAMHYDTVNPARREIVRLGLHLRDVLERDLSEDALSALAQLEPWYRTGASSDLRQWGAPLAGELSTFFRFVVTDLAQVYGGGGSGISYFLKSMRTRLAENPEADVSPLEQQFIDQALSGAWQSAQRKYRGDDPHDWSRQALLAVTQRPLEAFASLDGFGSLDPPADLQFAPLSCVDGETINSQAAQSYTQYVPMHDPDAALSILPIGQSELPNSPWRQSCYELWGTGKLHPAPLSYDAVQRIAVQQTRLP